jgi:hypothetical protein
VHRKRKQLLKKMEIVRLENEVVIFEIVFEMVHGQPYKRFQKNPSYTSFDYSSLELKKPELEVVWFLCCSLMVPQKHFYFSLTWGAPRRLHD